MDEARRLRRAVAHPPGRPAADRRGPGRVRRPVRRPGRVAARPRDFEPPRGAFFVGYRDGVPVATGAWRLRATCEALGAGRTAEVKRMYVAPAARVAAWPGGCSPTSRPPPRRGGRGDDPRDRDRRSRRPWRSTSRSGYMPIAASVYYRVVAGARGAYGRGLRIAAASAAARCTALAQCRMTRTSTARLRRHRTRDARPAARGCVGTARGLRPRRRWPVPTRPAATTCAATPAPSEPVPRPGRPSRRPAPGARRARSPTASKPWSQEGDVPPRWRSRGPTRRGGAGSPARRRPGPPEPG